MKYFVSLDEKAYGPYPLEDLWELLSSGQINSKSFILREGTTEWVPFHSFHIAAARNAAGSASPPPESKTGPQDERIQQLEQQLAAAVSAQKELAAVRGQKAEVESKVAALQTTNGDLLEKLKKAEQSAQRGAETSDSQTAHVKKLEAELAQARAAEQALTQARADKTRLEQQLSSETNARQELMSQVQSADQMRRTEAEQSAARAKRIQQLEQELGAAASAREELAKATARKTEVETLLTSLQKTHAETVARLQVAEQTRQRESESTVAQGQKIQTLEGELTQIRTIQQELQKTRADRAQLEQQLAAEQKGKKELLLRVQALEQNRQETAQAAQQISLQAKRIEQLEQELAKAAVARQELTKTLAQKSEGGTRMISLQKAHADVLTQLQSVQLTRKQEQEAYSGYLQRIRQLEAAVAQNRSEQQALEKARAQIADLEQQLAAANAAHKELAEHAQSLEQSGLFATKEAMSSARRVEELEQELAALKAKHVVAGSKTPPPRPAIGKDKLTTCSVCHKAIRESYYLVGADVVCCDCSVMAMYLALSSENQNPVEISGPHISEAGGALAAKS